MNRRTRYVLSICSISSAILMLCASLQSQGLPTTFPDPVVPMIQLPMKFKTQRANTDGRYGKNKPVDLLNVKGPGCVRHIWILFGFVVRMLGTHLPHPIPLNCGGAPIATPRA